MQNGDRELMKQGAMGALYLYGIQHLTEQGYSHALLGGVRPFLIDGVLQYKRKWGARLIAGDDGDPHWLMVAVTRPTEAVRDFLGACPLICEEDQGLVGRVLLDHTGSDDNERIQRQIADLTALGVERVEAIEIPRGAAHDDVDREETAQLIGARGNRRFTQRFGMRAIRRRDSNVSL